MSEFVFRGWDWEEVAEALSIVIPEKELEKDDGGSVWLAKELWKRMVWPVTGSDPEWPGGEEKACREFLRALIAAEPRGYSAPVYRAILRVRDPETFMTWFTRNLVAMWT